MPVHKPPITNAGRVLGVRGRRRGGRPERLRPRAAGPSVAWSGIGHAYTCVGVGGWVCACGCLWGWVGGCGQVCGWVWLWVDICGCGCVGVCVIGLTARRPLSRHSPPLPLPLPIPFPASGRPLRPLLRRAGRHRRHLHHHRRQRGGCQGRWRQRRSPRPLDVFERTGRGAWRGVASVRACVRATTTVDAMPCRAVPCLAYRVTHTHTLTSTVPYINQSINQSGGRARGRGRRAGGRGDQPPRGGH